MEKKIYINENERIDDLQYKGLKIIQNKNIKSTSYKHDSR